MSRKTQEFAIVRATDLHLRSTEDLYGSRLVALDGEIGHLRDFLFDDNIWVIRYAIADTGSWLTGRLVLISPYAFHKLDQDEKTLQVALRRIQIENSPSIESPRPVSRRFEAEYFRYYGWPPYWVGDAMWGVSSYPGLAPTASDETEEQRMYYHRDDKHLQSARELAGFPIHAVDGEVGHVKGFLVDDRSWAIRKLIVETGLWHSGQQIRISTDKVNWISYNESRIHVSLTKADIEKTAEPEPATVGAPTPGELHPRV